MDAHPSVGLDRAVGPLLRPWGSAHPTQPLLPCLEELQEPRGCTGPRADPSLSPHTGSCTVAQERIPWPRHLTKGSVGDNVRETRALVNVLWARGSPGCVYGAVNESTQPSDICVLQMRLLCMISSQVHCKTHAGGAGGALPAAPRPGKLLLPTKASPRDSSEDEPSASTGGDAGTTPLPLGRRFPDPCPLERDCASRGVKRFPSQLPARLSRGMHPNPLFSFNYLSVTNLAGKPIKRVGD